MQKQKHRELRKPAQGHLAGSEKAWLQMQIQNPCSGPAPLPGSDSQGTLTMYQLTVLRDFRT